MPKISNFEDLEIWKNARELCKDVYKITSNEPFIKDFRFRDQIRASAGSVMDNIAEGYEREGNKEFLQFLSIAKGSCGEARSQLYRAFDFGYIAKDLLDNLLEKAVNLSKQISNFMSYLRKSNYKGSKYKT